MSTTIACACCGFIFGFTDERVRYAGPACPACGEPLTTETAQSSRWAAEDRPGQFVARLFTPPAAGRRGAPERERVPALIDALDARLALWIAQSILSDKDAA